MKITRAKLKEIIKEAIGQSLSTEEPTGQPEVQQKTDVAMAGKKIEKTSGLADYLNRINNRVELEQFLGSVILPKLSEKLSGDDIYKAMVKVAITAKKK